MSRFRSGPARIDVDGATIMCHRGPGALEALPASWAELAATIPEPPPFSRPAWALPWWHTYGRRRTALVVEIHADRQLRAMIAFQITRMPPAGARCLEFLGGSAPDWKAWLLDPDGLGLQYYNDMLIQPGWERLALACLRVWLESEIQRWDLIRLTAVAEGSALGAGLAALTGRWSPRVWEDRLYRVDTSAGWEAFSAGVSKRQRRHLRYEPRALEREVGAPLEVAMLRGAAAEAGMEEFIALHDRRWKFDRRPGLDAGGARFYRALAAQTGSDLVIYHLVAAGRVIASQFGFDDGRSYLPYNFAFDPELAAHSPSNVLLQRIIERCCNDGHLEVNLAGLGSGGRWTNDEVVRRHLEATGSRPPAAVRARALSALRWQVRVFQRSSAGRRTRNSVAAALSAIGHRRAGSEDR